MGDLGHQLSAEQVEAIGKVDGILVPIGGTYTVDAAGAKQVCEALMPKWIVPMHYRHGAYGFPVLLSVEDFAALWDEVHRLKGPALEIKPDMAGVIVPEFC
jgi:L-ascorbate metabolism protein UlaG (beta-lactamase superfamily)